MRRASKGLVFGLLGAGTLVGFAAGAQPWATVRAGETTRVLSFSGADVTGGTVTVIPAVVLAGVLLTLTLHSAGRRVLGGVLTLVGAAMTAVGVTRPLPSAAEVLERVRRVSLSDAVEVERVAGWPLLYAAGGVLVLAAGVALLLGTAHWPTRADRYRRRVEGVERVRVDAREPEAGEEADPALVWRALDEGHDPTRDQTR